LEAHAKVYLCGTERRPEELKARLAAANPGSIVQAVQDGSITNGALVQMLAAQTFQAERSGTLLAKKPEVDLLLRLAGTTQIAKAIRERGAKPGASFLLIVASRSGIVGIPGLLQELPRSQLSDGDLARIERAALLDVARA